jgi:hypothetical protein
MGCRRWTKLHLFRAIDLDQEKDFHSLRLPMNLVELGNEKKPSQILVCQPPGTSYCPWSIVAFFARNLSFLSATVENISYLPSNSLGKLPPLVDRRIFRRNLSPVCFVGFLRKKARVLCCALQTSKKHRHMLRDGRILRTCAVPILDVCAHWLAADKTRGYDRGSFGVHCKILTSKRENFIFRVSLWHISLPSFTSKI